jgi:hypothetical protein
MQQGILGFLKVNVELLLLIRVETFEIKQRAPGYQYLEGSKDSDV